MRGDCWNCSALGLAAPGVLGLRDLPLGLVILPDLLSFADVGTRFGKCRETVSGLQLPLRKATASVSLSLPPAGLLVHPAYVLCRSISLLFHHYTLCLLAHDIPSARSQP